MGNRQPFFLLLGGAASILALAGTSAVSGQSAGLVRLQSATPGVQQTGHLNISGTVVAAQFQGGGSGLTGVNADLLDGVDSTAFLQSVPNPLTLAGTSATHIIRADNASTSAGSAAIVGVSTAGTGGTYGVYGKSASQNGRGVYGLAVEFGSCYGGYFENTANGFGVYGKGGTVGVFGDTNTTGTATGVAGQTNSAGVSSAGVSGFASATTGSTWGVFGGTNSNAGKGVEGTAYSTTGVTYGGYFDCRSGSGIGAYARNTASNGIGLYSESSSTASGTGIYALAKGSSSVGVYSAVTQTSGTNYAMYGITSSTSGVGVKGVVNPTTGFGVGVWGVCNAPSGWGVYADGRMGASGTKSFRIDHPLDPTNKWLLHYCSEGPEPLNVYSGIITADEKGYATVELPDYFDEINRDPRVQLTVEDGSDDFVMVKLTGPVEHGQVHIRANKPGVKVHWEVKAVRNDLWVRKYGAPVDQEKVGPDKGKLQHPELYGESAQKEPKRSPR